MINTADFTGGALVKRLSSVFVCIHAHGTSGKEIRPCDISQDKIVIIFSCLNTKLCDTKAK